MYKAIEEYEDEYHFSFFVTLFNNFLVFYGEALYFKQQMRPRLHIEL